MISSKSRPRKAVPSLDSATRLHGSAISASSVATDAGASGASRHAFRRRVGAVEPHAGRGRSAQQRRATEICGDAGSALRSRGDRDGHLRKHAAPQVAVGHDDVDRQIGRAGEIVRGTEPEGVHQQYLGGGAGLRDRRAAIGADERRDIADRLDFLEQAREDPHMRAVRQGAGGDRDDDVAVGIGAVRASSTAR
jgi:hypothetical protein